MRSHKTLLGLGAALSLVLLALSLYIGMNPGITAALLIVFSGLAFALAYGWSRRMSGEPAAKKAGTGHVLMAVAISAVVTMAGIQLVPYGRSHSNPPITGEPEWANARTRELAVAACYSCHSNEVDYPAYYTRFGLHADANLSDQEMQDLVDGLRATPGLSDR